MSWRWCRVYHESPYAPTAATFRPYGPLARFDHHTPPFGDPSVDPAGRSVLYVADSLSTGACEVFGEAGEVLVCPRWRVGIIEPIRSLTLLDLVPEGSAMSITALPALAQGDEPRSLTQQWARAIVEDEPAGPGVSGMHYRTAYAAGEALVLWDCPESVRAVDTGGLQDFPLMYPPLLARLRCEVQQDRNLPVTLISAADCHRCQHIDTR